MSLTLYLSSFLVKCIQELRNNQQKLHDKSIEK